MFRYLDVCEKIVVIIVGAYIVYIIAFGLVFAEAKLSKFSLFIKNNQTGVVFSAIVVLFIGIIIATYSLTSEGHINEVASKDIFEKSIDDLIKANLTDYVAWHRANIIMQSALIVTALLATVFASVTTKDNAESLKKYSIFLTAITSALTVGFATFHVRENVESFIKVNGELIKLEYDYLKDRDSVVINKDGLPDRQVQLEITKIQHMYMQRYVGALNVRMRAWANIGQQALPAASLNSSNNSDGDTAGKSQNLIGTNSPADPKK